MKKPKLGPHLEWHGNRIRVVVRVPPKLKGQFGSKLREVLVTRNPLEADSEKVPVVRRLRAKLRGQKIAETRNPLIEEALRWRQAAKEETVAKQLTDHQTTVAEALDDRVNRIMALHGETEARRFAAIASGTATPFTALLDQWFEEGAFSIGYQNDIRRMVGRLDNWCASTATMQSIEAINEAVAGDFVHENYIRPKVNHTTANKDISCLRAYWQWMGKRKGIKPNPWREQNVTAPSQRHDTGEGDKRKRPFYDDEVRTLLQGIKTKRDWQFSLMAALSGLRIDEIGSLRVKDCVDGKIVVAKSKTPAGKRTIPAHPALAPLIAERTIGKPPTAYLFDELPEQKPGSKRGRSAPVTQSFSRERVRLGVDERASKGQRQSNVDFHSWRRWFIRSAREASLNGATGYSMWTIPNVVGHKVEDGELDGVKLPLGLTMSTYAGSSSWEAMTACVNAVALPKGVSNVRDDFEGQSTIRRRKVKPRVTLQEAAE
ncbi:hypothetical protein E0H22_02685 [Rhodopseudomonas boonkerdii]|uniref:tyrosine-type recombinase/integrase n=1 Tax=Rhodopseudomonas boonkerdii TaxID=475937 RepID=UPI001E456FCB|nr:hypothetical protein [Rhodopseudomonas boonkerdii]UGV24686.1 hypothetical protein E0H22_02685 [Rhodopseudomonas boonkerdii]